MPRLQLRMRTLPRGEPRGDEGECLRLRELVLDAVSRGGAPLVAVVLRTDRLDIVGLDPLPDAGVALPLFLAGLSRSTADGAGEVEAVGLMGTVRVRAPGAGRHGPQGARVAGLSGDVGQQAPPVPMAISFLEWADCRWWLWRAPLDAESREVLEDTEVVTCAVAGDSLPPGLGRWWSLGRRRKPTVHLSAATPPPTPIEASTLVH